VGNYVKQAPCFACNGRGGTYYTDGYKCFSCGISYGGTGKLKAVDKKSTDELVWPPGTVFEPEAFTLDVKKWLYTHYVTDYLITKYSLGCIPESNAVVLPIKIDGELKSYSVRKFSKNSCKYKYITKGSKKEANFFTGQDIQSDKIVLVEDFLSSIRVGEYCPCLCLQGTNISDTLLRELIKKYNKIVIWLDDDEGGNNGYKKIKTRAKTLLADNYVRNLWALNPQMGKCVRLKTEKDPKCLSPNELKELL
jgi:hypothetical protein